MGYITTVTVNNDLLHQLTSRPPEDVCRIFYEGLMKMHGGREPIALPVAGITVVETHHADYAHAILVGGGREAQVITGININYTHLDPEMELLRQLAFKREFYLQRKRRKKE